MRRTFALAAALLAAAPAAHAQALYTGFDADRLAPTNARAAEAQFLADLVTFGTETFAGWPLGPVPEPTWLTFGTFGTGQVSETTSPRIEDVIGLEDRPGLWIQFAGIDAAARVLTFGGMNVQALGFFASGLNDIGQPAGAPSLKLDFFRNGAPVYSWTVGNPHTNTDNTMFIGIRGIAFDRVELRGQGEGKYWGADVWEAGVFNDITVGASRAVVTTPEPATAGLLAVGVAALAAAVRRRRV